MYSFWSLNLSTTHTLVNMCLLKAKALGRHCKGVVLSEPLLAEATFRNYYILPTESSP